MNEDLETYLHSILLLRSKSGALNWDQVGEYSSPEEIVLREGHRFNGERDRTVRAMRPRHCFNNAYSLAINTPGLYYCEGWALSIIPVQHAWCCDEQGVIYDPTWINVAVESDRYLGCIFSHQFIAQAALSAGAPGIFYHHPKIDERLWRGDFELVKLNEA